MEVSIIEQSDHNRNEKFRLEFIVNGASYKVWKHLSVYELARAHGWIEGFIHVTQKTEEVVVVEPMKKPHMCSYCHGTGKCNCEW